VVSDTESIADQCLTSLALFIIASVRGYEVIISKRDCIPTCLVLEDKRMFQKSCFFFVRFSQDLVEHVNPAGNKKMRFTKLACQAR